MSLSKPAVTISMIQEARERLAKVALHTNLLYSTPLSEACGGQVYLKTENLQRTGSFKLRGAYNKIASLTPQEREKGIIASSAGNHAQGVALAAATYGCKATICMPKHAPISKVTATRSYGADTVLYGDFYDETYAKAIELQQEHGYTFCHPFDDPFVMAGQGTIGLEILDDLPDVDMIVVPIGGGGLISGIAAAAKSINPDIQIIGVQTQQVPSMKVSRQIGCVTTVPGGASLADGIMVKTPGELTFDTVQRYVDDIVTVEETEIAHAIQFLLEKVKVVAEGAGAVPTAALLHGKIPNCEGKKIAAMISGGNIDINLITRIINTGLIKTGRKVYLDTIMPDTPGSLCGVLELIAQSGANVLAVTHDRSQKDVEVGFSHVAFELETYNEQHIQSLIESLEAHHHKVQIR